MRRCQQTAANTANAALVNKLNKNAADTLSAVLSVQAATVAGLRVGDLEWNASGVRTLGKGVAMTPAGTQIRLNEVAEVYDGLAEVRSDIRANGKAAVAFEVIKQSGTNTVQVADAVKKKLDEVLPMVSKELVLGNIFDQSTFIRESTHEVQISIVY